MHLGFVIYMITRESMYYINLRQAYLMSPNQVQRIHSRTVLFTSVPANLLHRDRLATMLGVGVKRIWIPTDTKELEELVEKRDKVAMKLEGAENKLIKTATKNKFKTSQKGNTSGHDDGETGNPADRWIPRKKQPHHRTGLLGLIGTKVETIPWCRSELEKLIPEVENMQDEAFEGKGNRLNSVFVEFATMNEAQAAFQSVAHHLPLHMAPRFIGVKPNEVVWSNLKIRWYERVVRRIGANAAVTALVIFWSIPVAFVGAISNVQALTAISAFKWLSFLNDIPPAILGVVNGLLPSILLAVLMALLPIFLRCEYMQSKR
jgi:calcium permeable stress-gated cation channel